MIRGICGSRSCPLASRLLLRQSVMLIPPLPRRDAIHVFEGARKVQLVWIADGVANVRDGQVCKLQELRRLCHAIGNQKFLR